MLCPLIPVFIDMLGLRCHPEGNVLVVHPPWTQRDMPPVLDESWMRWRDEPVVLDSRRYVIPPRLLRRSKR